MDTKRNKILNRIIAGIILIGLTMVVVGGIGYKITDNWWWRDFAADGIAVILFPVFCGMAYILSAMAFGIKIKGFNDD